MVIVHRGKYNNNKVYNRLSHDVVTWEITKFRLFIASLHQAMKATGYAPCAIRTTVVGCDRLCSCEKVSPERSDLKLFLRRLADAPVSCCVSWALVSTLDSVIPVVWIASLISRVYQCESRSTNFTSFQSVCSPIFLGAFRKGRGLGTGESYIPNFTAVKREN